MKIQGKKNSKGGRLPKGIALKKTVMEEDIPCTRQEGFQEEESSEETKAALQ